MVWQPTAWQLCPHKCHLPLEHNSHLYLGAKFAVLAERHPSAEPSGPHPSYLREGRGGERKAGRGQGGMAPEREHLARGEVTYCRSHQGPRLAWSCQAKQTALTLQGLAVPPSSSLEPPLKFRNSSWEGIRLLLSPSSSLLIWVHINNNNNSFLSCGMEDDQPQIICPEFHSVSRLSRGLD